MGEEPSDLNQRIDQARRAAFLRVLVAHKLKFLAAAFVGLFMLVGVPWIIAYRYSPLEYITTTQGEFISTFIPPRRISAITSRSTLIASARLVDGATVSVRLFDPLLYRPDETIDIKVYRHVWWPHSLVYRFEGYAENERKREP